MRRHLWPTRGASVESPRDPAHAILEHVARAIGKRAADVFRVPIEIAYDVPVLAAQAPAVGASRAWRCEAGAGVCVWLALEDSAARELLALVLGGPASPEPTALERAIVKETVERIVAGTGLAWEEPETERMPRGELWRGAVHVRSMSGIAAVLTLIAPPIVRPTSAPAATIRGDRISIAVRCAIVAERQPLRQVAHWSPGDLVLLGASPAPVVTMFAGAVAIGSGELGVLSGRRAVRVTAAAGTP